MKCLNKLLLMLIFSACCHPVFTQGVSINNTGNKADTSAMLDVSSTTKGFLMPRMTSTQRDAIVLPAPGLMFFNTTLNLLQMNTGSTSTATWASLPGIINYSHTIFTPSTGGTVSLINNSFNIINPSLALVSVTLNLPSSPANNDIVYIKFTQAVSVINYSGGTVNGSALSAAKGALIALVYDLGNNVWY